MEEWKEYKYTDLCTLIGGGTPKTSEPSYWGGDIPWLSVKDFGNDEKYVYSTEKTITEAGLNNSSTKLLRRDDIIISARGTIGAIAMLASEMAFNQSCFGIRSNDIVEQHYLYYLTKTKISELQKNSHGSVFDTITRDTFAKIDCVIPSKKIQRQIASILSSLDDKIEVNRKINENLEQQAQALFKSWFVDFEPFKNGEFVESELEMIPKGWRVGTLKEIADIIMGTSPSGSSYNTEGIGDVFYQGRAEFGFRFPKRNMYTTEAKRFAEVDTVLVSVRAPVGDINVAEERCCIGRGLASVKSKNNYNSYILYLMQSLKNVFDRFNGEGTVFGSINKKAFEEMQIIVPTGNVISKFDSIASSMDCQIKRTEQQSRRLAELRDTLLPKLMSGELKVNEIVI